MVGEAVDRAVEALELDCSAATVLDLATGTGKLTRALVPRVGRVIAVEPDASMRDLLVQATACYLALEGTAEAMPLADCAADAVFETDIVLDAGQAASLWLSVSSVTMLPREEHAVLGERLRAGLAGSYRLSTTTELLDTARQVTSCHLVRGRRREVSTTSNAEPGTRPSVRKSSFDQR